MNEQTLTISESLYKHLEAEAQLRVMNIEQLLAIKSHFSVPHFFVGRRFDRKIEDRKMWAYSICRLTVLALLFSVTTAFAQEPEKKPESISTEPELLSVTLKVDNGDSVKISRSFFAGGREALSLGEVAPLLEQLTVF